MLFRPRNKKINTHLIKISSFNYQDNLFQVFYIIDINQVFKRKTKLSRAAITRIEHFDKIEKEIRGLYFSIKFNFCSHFVW